MKRGKRKKAYIALLLAAIMILSVFGIVLSNQSPLNDAGKLEYNDITFRLINNQWTAEIKGKERSFFFSPIDLSEKTLPSELRQAIVQTPTMTITFDPNISQLHYLDAARFELSEVLLLDFGKNIRHGVTNATGAYEFPVVSCQPSAEELFITFIEANVSSAQMDGNCVTIAAVTPVEYIQYSEKLIYLLLEVIP